MTKEKLLAFDLLRIISIILIVFSHVAFRKNWIPWNQFPVLFNIFELNVGKIGVYIFLFISGAMLQYNYNKIKDISDLKLFYMKRLMRIYPAIWITIIFVLIFHPELFNEPINLFWGFTGFTAFVGQWSGIVPGSSNWFVGLIVILYLLFPLLSHLIQKLPHVWIIVFALISFSLCFYFHTHNLEMLGVGTCGWFPFAHLFEFALGIYVVQLKLYPKIKHKSDIITFLSELTFPIFLIHGLLLPLSVSNIPMFAFGSLFLATMIYLMDRQIQKILKWNFKIQLSI